MRPFHGLWGPRGADSQSQRLKFSPGTRVPGTGGDKLWIPVNRWSTRVTTARGKHGCQQTGRRRASCPDPPIGTCEAQAPCWAGTHLPFPVSQAPPLHAGSPAPPTREAPLPECCGDGFFLSFGYQFAREFRRRATPKCDEDSVLNRTADKEPSFPRGCPLEPGPQPA